MIINPQTLRGIYVGFNTMFNKAFAGYTPEYTDIATVVPSTTDSETYAWLGDLPGLRKWVGEREIKNLSGSDYTIKNDDFELTVGVPRNAVEDDKIGVYKPSIELLGDSAARKPDELVFDLLKRGFTEKCYDGSPYFSDSHKVGSMKVSNKGTGKLTQENYFKARASMMSIVNSEGQPMSIVPDLLVVPPALEEEGKKILEADMIAGSTSTSKGTAKLKVSAQLAGNDTAWFLLATTRPIKPFIFQERTKAKFVSKTQETDDNVFFDKTLLYGVDFRGNAGFSLWQLAYGSTGTATK